MRKTRRFGVVCMLGTAGLLAQAGQPHLHSASRYLPASTTDYGALIPDPPATGSEEQRAELAVIHAAEQSRTKVEIAQAQADDAEESMFAFADVVGPELQASRLPLSTALSLHLRQESAVVGPALKLRFNRPRPFVSDPSLRPVCEKTASMAYPSGHSMVGYLEAFALVQMLPERKDAILARARQFAANRVVCGVHYPSDVEASHTVALALFGALETSPRFQQELAAARTELRCALRLDCGGAGQESDRR